MHTALAATALAATADPALLWWAVLGAAALLLATCVRRSAAEAVTVVVRGGRVARVAGGWALRAPVVEEFRSWPAEPVELPLVVPGRTADGFELRLLADVTVALPTPRVRTPYADPLRSAERAAEDAFRTAVGTRVVSRVLDETDGLASAVRADGLGDAGEVLSVDLLELEVLLAPGAAVPARPGSIGGPGDHGPR